MPVAYWCVLVAALLPLIWVALAKWGAPTTNRHPREEVGDLPPHRRRAYAAHQNAYENFPFFAAAVIVAVTSGAPLAAVNGLALIYLVLRILHGLCYVGNYSTPRSIVYTLGLLVNIAIFVLPVWR